MKSSQLQMGVLRLLVIAIFMAAARPTLADPARAELNLTELQRQHLMDLADHEANIQAINKVLKTLHYAVGKAYDRIDSNLKGNELMDRKGGGPVRWDEFYGKTARAYASNGWGDTPPRQFDFVYKANNDQISRAQDRIASLGTDLSRLLALREKHEAEQVRLWAAIAFEQVKDHEIATEESAIFRSKLKSGATPPDKRLEILRPFVLYLRSADKVAQSGLESVANDPDATFASMKVYMDTGYKTLRVSFTNARDSIDLTDGDKKRAGELEDLCKRLAEQCQVVADNHHSALDRDSAKEDVSKLKYRERLQESLGAFAAQFDELHEQILAAAKVWNVSNEKGVATSDTVAEMVIQRIAPPSSSPPPAAPMAAWSVGSRWINSTPPRPGFSIWTVRSRDDSQIQIERASINGQAVLVVKLAIDKENKLTVLRISHDPPESPDCKDWTGTGIVSPNSLALTFSAKNYGATRWNQWTETLRLTPNR